MTSDRAWARPEMLVSKVAAAAVAELHDSVMEHATHMGRSGIMVRLRVQARELAQSCVGRDQVRSCAFEAAADDIAWGRAPLAAWRTFALEAAAISDSDRAAVRANVPDPDKATEARGGQIARDIERWALTSHDAFDAIRGLASELSAAAEIQALLWDDPRITAAPDLRAVMRASIAPLQRRAGALARDLRPPSISPQPTAPPISGWRKLFAARRGVLRDRS